MGALGLALVAGACSSAAKSNNASSNETPAQAVATGLSGLGSQSSVRLSVSLPISAAQAEQLAGKGSTGPTPAEAKALTESTLFFTEATGHGEAIDSTQAQTDAQDAFDFGWTAGSATPVEIRYVDQNLYVKVDVKQVLSTIGQNAAKGTQFTNQLSSLNGEIPGISAVAAGAWGEITHAGLLTLGAALKQSAGANANPSTLRSDAMRLRTEALAALKADSTIASLGSSKGRNEYSVTVQVATLVDTLGPELSSTFGNIPGLGSRIGNSINHTKLRIPAGQTAVVDVFVAGGKLSEADLDLNQFQHSVSFAVPLRIEFSSPGTPSTPSGATNVDVSKVPGLLSGLLGGLSSGSASSSGRSA